MGPFLTHRKNPHIKWRYINLTPQRLTLNTGDYYTRDRSTPRRDEFYGGNDDLTAAVGWEENGVTTIMFR